jgi:hydroxymethylglutaryl-CoA synthase
MTIPPTGIASIGLAFPDAALTMETLAGLRGVDENKLRTGLGCREMALCPEGTDVVTLATRAATRAIERWGKPANDIGLIVVGSETAKDMSRPLSAFVAENLGLAGAVRSYEVKHACYGGTVALRNALEWRLSGAARGKAALVIAADVALYAPCDPGEPTQGAGAVAMIVDEPTVAKVDLASYAWSEPAFDFWRPVGEAYPRVEGKLSIECYARATERCFAQLLEVEGAGVLDTLRAACFHVPFPKMVTKATVRLGEVLGWDEARTSAFHERRIEPFMRWNQHVGNAYTAGLWISVASALAEAKPKDRIAAFSYGSGFGAELLMIEAAEGVARAEVKADFDAYMQGRSLMDASTYVAYRERVIPAH